MESNKIIEGDCIEELKKLPENSVDAIVTDPPYGLEFMGKEWDKFEYITNKHFAKGFTDPNGELGHKDYAKRRGALPRYSKTEPNKLQQFCTDWATECLRVLKPGGFLLSFGGTRTYHRLVCGIEDAGFEIRDTIMWLYGSGFPKSLNIGKQIDKLQGNERESKIITGKVFTGSNNNINGEAGQYEVSKGTSEWEGWGTALKPACEPIVVARKPLSEKNVALNVLKWGTGGINIDGCRVGVSGNDPNHRKIDNKNTLGTTFGSKDEIKSVSTGKSQLGEQGRFPANIILDEEAGKMLDKQSGDSSSTGGQSGVKDSGLTYSMGWKEKTNTKGCGFGDKGGASRFFYCAKASKSERNLGCENLEEKEKVYRATSNGTGEVSKNMERFASVMKNNHPTVKPIKLMEYLIRLVTPKGGIVLDPFLGSGTTAIACIKEGANYIGIEKEPEYIKIAKSRLKPYLEQKKL